MFVVSLVVCFLCGELLYRLQSTTEVSRKVVHLGACLLTAMHPAFGLDRSDVGIVALGALVALVTLRGSPLLRSINMVGRRTFGDVLLPFSVCILVGFGSSQSAFLSAYVLLGVADTAACLVGSRYGRRPLPILNGRKTWLGSAAFLASCLTYATLPVLFASDFSVSYLVLTFGFCVLLTLVEAVCSLGTDNLFIPLSVALFFDTLEPMAWLS